MTCRRHSTYDSHRGRKIKLGVRRNITLAGEGKGASRGIFSLENTQGKEYEVDILHRRLQKKFDPKTEKTLRVVHSIFRGSRLLLC